MPVLRPLLLGVLMPLLGGCLGSDLSSTEVSTKPAAVSPHAAQQFMLRFRDGRDEHSVRASLARLSQRAGLELIYVRPMSGQAHVLRFPASATPAQVEQALRTLRVQPEVEYAEQDLRVQHQ